MSNHQRDMIDADYEDFIRAWRESAPTSGRPPRGTFPDMNFMADEILGIYPLPGDEWAEVSWGRAFGGGRVIGVTVARPGNDAWIARTRGVEVFDAMGAALGYLRGLTQESSER